MKKRLKEELRKLSTDIITSRDTDSLEDLYEAAKNLYEKLAVLKFIEEKLNHLEVDVSKSVIAAKFEKMANAVLSENASVPESNPHQEDIMIPGIDTIKDMVSEMPNETSSETPVDDFLAEFWSKPEYMKNDMELFMPRKDSQAKRDATNRVRQDVHQSDQMRSDQWPPPKANGSDAEQKKANPSDATRNEAKPRTFKAPNPGIAPKKLVVDLNNRLAFVKHLFNGSMEDYNRVLSQLNTIDTHERSVAFIDNMVKPDYDQWTGKEEYEERFMLLIERRFS